MFDHLPSRVLLSSVCSCVLENMRSGLKALRVSRFGCGGWSLDYFVSVKTMMSSAYAFAVSIRVFGCVFCCFCRLGFCCRWQMGFASCVRFSGFRALSVFWFLF